MIWGALIIMFLANFIWAAHCALTEKSPDLYWAFFVLIINAHIVGGYGEATL